MPVESVDPPQWLPDGAATIWNEYAAILTNRKMMHSSFKHSLAMLSQLTHEWMEVTKYLHRSDDFINRITQESPTSGNVSVSAEFVVRAKLQDQIVKLLGQFGLTPATLSSIASSLMKDEEEEVGDNDDGSAENSFLRIVG